MSDDSINRQNNQLLKEWIAAALVDSKRRQQAADESADLRKSHGVDRPMMQQFHQRDTKRAA